MTTETEASKSDGEQHSIGVIANQAHAAATIQIRDRIKEFRRVQAKDLVPNPKNWRRHPKAQVEALRGLLTEIGYADALLVRELADGRLMLIDGHLRAATTPDALVPVLVLDVTEAEADKLLATLDPLAAMAESDSDRIEELLATVSTDSEAVQELLKRTAGERVWELLHPRELKEVEVAPEKADELRQKWGTKSGQLWQIDPHRIVCGDSTDPAIVGQLWSDDSPFARIVLTDPPYGVSYGEKTNWTNRHGGGPNRRPIENDSLGPAELQDGGFTYRHCLVWIKQTFVLGRSDYHYRHEPILYGWIGNGPHYFVDDRTHDSVFEVDRPQASDLHPTTKPVELIARMIANSSRPGDLVYDPFGGSGSTIIAAHQLGRVGYTCELDPGYIAVQLERLSMLGLKPEMVGK